MSATRTRTEARIERLDTYTGEPFERALTRVILRGRSYLDFYTDEQLEEIAAQMVRDAWFTHRLNRENRKRFASLQSLQTKEQTDA